MAAVVALKAELRDKTGKGGSRVLRRANRVPAIIYGKGSDSVPISLDLNEINRYCYKANFCSIIAELEISGKKYKVLPRLVQLNPVTDVAEHIDFMKIEADTLIKVTVHLRFLNEDKCLGIKRGGIINYVKRDIQIMCPPNAIPHHIDIDISNLNIGSSIHVHDIQLPENCKPLVTAKDFTLATIVGRAKDEEASEVKK